VSVLELGEMTSRSVASLGAKVKAVERLFQRSVDHVFESPSGPEGYRMRMSMRLLRDGTNGGRKLAFNSPIDGSLVHTSHVPIAHERINSAFKIIERQVSEDKRLNQDVFEAKFHTTLRGELAVSLLYNKEINQDEWLNGAEDIRKELLEGTSATEVQVIGRARKQLLYLDRHYLYETMRVQHPHTNETLEFHYKQNTETFSQPNALVNELMLTWATKVSDRRHGIVDNDLLELYCGNGNFTVPLAKLIFDSALASETNRAAVADARWALQYNDVSNTNVVRMSSQDMSGAYFGERQYERLRDIDLLDLRPRTIFVDPPRAGLDASSVDLLAEHEGQALYISCNPLSLKRDLDNIKAKSRHNLIIHELVCFDQFPGTDHIECGVELELRPNAL